MSPRNKVALVSLSASSEMWRTVEVAYACCMGWKCTRR
jgi:hypothetical protein